MCTCCGYWYSNPFLKRVCAKPNSYGLICSSRIICSNLGGFSFEPLLLCNQIFSWNFSSTSFLKMLNLFRHNTVSSLLYCCDWGSDDWCNKLLSSLLHLVVVLLLILFKSFNPVLNVHHIVLYVVSFNMKQIHEGPLCVWFDRGDHWQHWPIGMHIEFHQCHYFLISQMYDWKVEITSFG